MNGHYVSPPSSLDSLFLFSLAHNLNFSLSNTYHYFVPIGGFFLVICVFCVFFFLVSCLYRLILSDAGQFAFAGGGAL